VDVRAELTLRLARVAHEHERDRPPRTGNDWFLVPEFRKISWEELRDALATAPKPLVVAPLIEPGYLSIWRINALETEVRQRVERHMANQVEYFTEKLKVCELEDGDPVELTVPGHELTLTVAELLQWAREYTAPLGVSVNRFESHVGHFVLMPPGGGGPPIGWKRPKSE